MIYLLRMLRKGQDLAWTTLLLLLHQLLPDLCLFPWKLRLKRADLREVRDCIDFFLDPISI